MCESRGLGRDTGCRYLTEAMEMRSERKRLTHKNQLNKKTGEWGILEVKWGIKGVSRN